MQRIQQSSCSFNSTTMEYLKNLQLYTGNSRQMHSLFIQFEVFSKILLYSYKILFRLLFDSIYRKAQAQKYVVKKAFPLTIKLNILFFTTILHEILKRKTTTSLNNKNEHVF